MMGIGCHWGGLDVRVVHEGFGHLIGGTLGGPLMVQMFHGG